MDEQSSGKARGGFARAEALAPERRAEIARQAAAARWGDAALPHATHEGPLRIGDIEIPAAVLEDGTRLLISKAFLTALGRPWKGSYRRTGLPNFLDAGNLSAFISNDLLDVLEPVEFKNKRGQKVLGYKAELLPKVIEVYLKARAARKLKGLRQKEIADQAELLGRGLMHMGIVGLVDEATGYQEVRDRHALQAILDQYLRKELAAWAKTFPDEFYYHIFRLRKWEWKGRKVNPPQVVAHYTKDFVYYRLAPGIVEELNRRNPVINGRRKAINTQWLTPEVGHPALAQHLHAVVALLRASSTWEQFKQMLDIALPRKDETVQLPLFKDPPQINHDTEGVRASSEPLPLFARSPDAALT